MDKALRDEFRAYKIETDDRIARLEKAVKTLSEPSKAIAAERAETKPAANVEPKKP